VGVSQRGPTVTEQKSPQSLVLFRSSTMTHRMTWALLSFGAGGALLITILVLFDVVGSTSSTPRAMRLAACAWSACALGLLWFMHRRNVCRDVRALADRLVCQISSERVVEVPYSTILKILRISVLREPLVVVTFSIAAGGPRQTLCFWMDLGTDQAAVNALRERVQVSGGH
jgi:hypothetical protein